MHQQRIDGYILHSRKFGDTSLIVDVLRADDIRESFICKGVCRPRSRFAGVLRPFAELSIECHRRTGMPLITEVSVYAAPPFVEPKAMYCGLYLNELLTYLLKPHDVHEGIFLRYRAAMEALKSAAPIEPVLRCFERDLLALLGYGMALEYDSLSGQPVQPNLWYDYQLEFGPVCCPAPDNAGEVTGYRVSGASLLALATGDFTTQGVQVEAKGLLRYVLNFHLEGRRLRSRDLFRSS